MYGALIFVFVVLSCAVGVIAVEDEKANNQLSTEGNIEIETQGFVAIMADAAPDPFPRLTKPVAVKRTKAPTKQNTVTPKSEPRPPTQPISHKPPSPSAQNPQNPYTPFPTPLNPTFVLQNDFNFDIGRQGPNSGPHEDKQRYIASGSIQVSVTRFTNNTNFNYLNMIKMISIYILQVLLSVVFL